MVLRKKDVKTKEKKDVKTKEKKEMKFHQLFTMNEVSGGKIVLNPKLDKFGVAAIKIVTNDEEEITLNEDSALWANKIEGTTKQGKPYSFYNVSLAQEI